MGRYDNYQEFKTLVSNLCSAQGFRFVEAFEHAPLMDKLVILSLVEESEGTSHVDKSNYRLKYYVDIIKFTSSSTDLGGILGFIDALINSLDSTDTYKTYKVEYRYAPYGQEDIAVRDDNSIVMHARVIIEARYVR
ncbi:MULTISPECIES: hypothetical protein [Candidatus Nitrosocaldus]|jgi:hypothetical protein|uniref:Uncharacterized protein n=1 Tax=Candidatus Nitrosocaldus cavascurensis TaxID=2058097 RepID=A0A2K5AQK3_9ARCH|nr:MULTISPECIES: hypothetical protein [Candidatus Nitrosocaldus]SPC33879.1 protein of unknown function [Candidatus Nitrosocaldus cavascurensis]